MPPGHVHHGGNGRTRDRQSDVRTQVEQAEDRPFLLVPDELLERPGQMTTGASHGGTACPVVPVGGGEQRETRNGVWEPHQGFFDQETVDDDPLLSRGSGLLIREIGIGYRRQAVVVSILEHSSQLLARHRRASWDDQSGATQVYEADLATLLDALPPTQLSRKGRLASM